MGLWPSIARKKMVIFMLWRLFLPWLHVSGELKKVNCECKTFFLLSNPILGTMFTSLPTILGLAGARSQPCNRSYFEAGI